MIEFTHKEYMDLIKAGKKEVMIGDLRVGLRGEWDIRTLTPPDDYTPEKETVWSFPSRGGWATHVGDYRGNWSPYIPRNLLTRYSKVGDLILDQMMGSGTTLVECKLLSRNGIGVDVNPNAVIVARDRLNFRLQGEQDRNVTITTYVGDARNLDRISSESIDLIATHPPYAKIITYTKRSSGIVDGDLSRLSFKDYLQEMRKVADESLRVLKPGKHCAILIGDTRKQKHYIPIAFRVMQTFLDAGFILREDIIKRQWKMKGTREKWRGRGYDFYLIAHEHIFVFRKPVNQKEYSIFKHSSRAMFE
jgi:DNA modification methylase